MRNNANIKKRLNRLESFEDCRFVKPKLSTSFWSDARNGFRRHRQTSWCFRPNCCIGTPCKRQWSIGDPSGRRSRLCLSSRRDLVPDVFIRRPRPELSKMRRSKLQNSRKRHQKTNDCLRRSGCLGKPDQRQCCAGHWRSGIQLRRPHCRIHGRFMRDVLDAANSTLQLGKRTWKDTAEYMQEIGEVLSEKYRQVKGTFRRHLAEIFRDEYAEEDIAQARDFLSQYGFHLSSILLSELNTTIWVCKIYQQMEEQGARCTLVCRFVFRIRMIGLLAAILQINNFIEQLEKPTPKRYYAPVVIY